MKSESKQVSLASGYDPIFVRREDLDAIRNRGDDGRANEDRADRAAGNAANLDIGFKAVDLTAEGIPLDRDVHDAQSRLVLCSRGNRLGHEDHTGAGAEERAAGGGEVAERSQQPVASEELADGGTFASRENQPLDSVHLLRCTHRTGLDPKAAKCPQVLYDIALNGKNSEGHASLLCGRDYLSK